MVSRESVTDSASYASGEHQQSHKGFNLDLRPDTFDWDKDEDEDEGTTPPNALLP